MAIYVEEDPGVARAVAAEGKLTAILVADPEREIADGYGATFLPTIVKIQSGTIAGIKYGYVPGDPLTPPSRPPSKPTGASR